MTMYNLKITEKAIEDILNTIKSGYYEKVIDCRFEKDSNGDAFIEFNFLINNKKVINNKKEGHIKFSLTKEKEVQSNSRKTHYIDVENLDPNKAQEFLEIYKKIEEAKQNGEWMVVINQKLTKEQKAVLEKSYGYKIKNRTGKFDYTTIMW